MNTTAFPTSSLIVVAGGASTRMGGSVKKPFIELLGKPLLLHTLEAFAGIPWLVERVVVVPLAEFPRFGALPDASGRALISEMTEPAPPAFALGAAGITSLVVGGARRQDSVFAGLRALKRESDLVLIHDGARPFTTREMIEAVATAAARHGGAVPGLLPQDTIKSVDERGMVRATPERSSLRAVQTPQAFRRAELTAAYERFNARDVTDDAALFELAGGAVFCVEGRPENIKITTPDDLPIAEMMLSMSMSKTTGAATPHRAKNKGFSGSHRSKLSTGNLARRKGTRND